MFKDEESPTPERISTVFVICRAQHNYIDRFSLCVLDLVRRLQQNEVFHEGVEKCHIVEYLRHQPYLDGDISSQVSIALRHLEKSGYLMYMKNGYKTLGPFAKLVLAKTQKYRRTVWRKLDQKLNSFNANADIMLPFVPRKNRRVKSESDFQNNGSRNTLTSQELEEF